MNSLRRMKYIFDGHIRDIQFKDSLKISGKQRGMKHEGNAIPHGKGEA